MMPSESMTGWRFMNHAKTLMGIPSSQFIFGLVLPGHAARQLPAQSTTRWVEPSSTGVSRLRGAPETADIGALAKY
jgi:hypothetical protein